MAADMFLKLDGIKGESKDSKHADEIEIENYHFGVEQQGTASHGSGLAAGRSSFQDFQFQKRIDVSSDTLFLKCATGEHIKTAKLTVRKAGTEQQEYFKVTLSDVLISHFASSGSEGAVPMETISLNFTKASIEYHVQNEDGSLKGSSPKTYDIKERKAS